MDFSNFCKLDDDLKNSKQKVKFSTKSSEDEENQPKKAGRPKKV